MGQITVKGRLKSTGHELDLVWKNGMISPAAADVILSLEENSRRRRHGDWIEVWIPGAGYFYPWRPDPNAFVAICEELFEDPEIQSKGVRFKTWPTRDRDGNRIIY